MPNTLPICRSVNINAIAQSYALFAGVLVAFTILGLCAYVSRPDDKDQVRLIEVSEVTAAIFYAMGSLTISAFLYSNLQGITNSNPRAAVTALLLYGIIFALAVLSLFYAITLMVLENPLTRAAAVPAFWSVTIIGALIVLRYLAGSVRDAVIATYPPPTPPRCAPPPLPAVLSFSGIAVTLLIAALISMFITIRFQRADLDKTITVWRPNPTLAPCAVFGAAVLVATLGSLFLNTRDDTYHPSRGQLYGCYAASISLIAFFTLACGRVVAPRAKIVLAPPSFVTRWRQVGRTGADSPLRHKIIWFTTSGSLQAMLAATGAIIWLVSIGPDRAPSLAVVIPAVLAALTSLLIIVRAKPARSKPSKPVPDEPRSDDDKTPHAGRHAKAP